LRGLHFRFDVAVGAMDSSNPSAESQAAVGEHTLSESPVLLADSYL
jgi:hypothetical protein